MIWKATKFNGKLFGLIVENTFTSLPDIGRELFGGIPGISYLPDLCFKNQYQSIDKVKHLTVPGLFISGQADTMIPPKMMSSLFDVSWINSLFFFTGCLLTFFIFDILRGQDGHFLAYKS
jgi:hypothetical protein